MAVSLMSWVESMVVKPHNDMVLSRIEVNATAEDIWPNVVKFSDISPPDDWLFNLGIAHPIRARIDGHGVGAVRQCEFSTGTFVEPITMNPIVLLFLLIFNPCP